MEEEINFYRKRINMYGWMIWITVFMWGVYWLFTKQYLFLFIALCIATGQEVGCQLIRKKNG